MGRVALFPVLGLALALLPACALMQRSGLETPGRAPSLQAPKGYRAKLGLATWALERVSADGTVIWIRSEESGCNSFHHAEFREVKGGLRVIALDRVLIPKRGYGCLLPLIARRHRVELPRPLGQDRIFGECVPGDETPEQRACALLHGAAGR